MKAHTSQYKEEIKKFGRQIDSLITYTSGGQTIELGKEQLNSITPHYEGAILKSVMKQLDIDSNVEIPEGTIINLQFGVLVSNSYEYVDYGNYVVYQVEKQEDTRSYKITCYDKMLYSMIPYEAMTITYPITIRNYLSAICTKLGLTFKNASDTFANYDKTINKELYLDENGNDLGYTFRDVLDEIAGATGSTICINEDDDKLEVRYIKTAIGKNLLDLSKCINGYINNTGGIVGGNANLLTDYIEVQSGNKYTISLNTQFSNIGYAYFDGNKTYVSRQNNNNKQSITLTIPNGVSYIRIWLNKDGNTDMTPENTLPYKPMVELGENRTSYEPYGDTIDEEYLKDVNVNFGEKYGPVNSIVLSRSAESDNIYLRDETSVTQNGLCEIKIKDNQILNSNNRDEFLQGLLDTLNGLEYYINDFTSTGITYYDLCDMYNVSIDNNIYKCVMFNNEVDITQGLEEQVYTEMPEESETDYTKADKTDRKINQAYIIVDKQVGQIESRVSKTESNIQDLDGRTTANETSITQLTTLTQDYNSIVATVQSLDNTVNTEGVAKVKTTSVTIDNSGLNVSTDTSKISTQMTNNAFEIKDSGNTTLAFFGYDETEGISKAEMDNLTVTNYFIAGVHRVEKYAEDGEDRTGWFYIGG